MGCTVPVDIGPAGAARLVQRLHIHRIAQRLQLAPERQHAARWDHIWFDCENFNDLRETAEIPGQEPTYDFEADIYKVIFTLWY